MLLSLLLLDLQGEAGAENPLGSSETEAHVPSGSHCPARPGGHGRHQGRRAGAWLPASAKVAPSERVCSCVPGSANRIDGASLVGSEPLVHRTDQSYPCVQHVHRTHTRARGE